MVNLRLVFESFALTASYVALAAIAFAISTFFAGVSPVWPASGLAVLVLWTRGLRLFPGLALAVGTLALLSGQPVAVVTLGGAAQLGEALLTVAILRSFKVKPTFQEPREILALLGASLAGASIIGVLGSCGFVWLDVVDREDLGVFAATWIGSRLVGLIAIVPLAAVPSRWKSTRPDRRRFILTEIFGWIVAIASVPGIAFALTDPPIRPMLLALMIPVVVISALRQGLLAAAGVNLAAVIAALVAAALYAAPTVTTVTPLSPGFVVSVSGFLAILVSCGLLAAVVVDAVRAAKDRNSVLAQRWQSVFDRSDDGITIVGADLKFHEVNKSYARSLGYQPEDLIGKPVSIVWFEGTKDSRGAAFQGMRETGKARIRSFDRHRSGRPVAAEYNASFVDAAQERKTLSVVRNLDTAHAAENIRLGQALGRAIAPLILETEPERPSQLVPVLAELRDLLDAADLVLVFAGEGGTCTITASGVIWGDSEELACSPLAELLRSARGSLEVNVFTGAVCDQCRQPSGPLLPMADPAHDLGHYLTVGSHAGPHAMVLGISSTQIVNADLMHALVDQVQRALGARREARELRRRAFTAARLETAGTMAAGLTHDFNNLLAAIVTNLALIAESDGLDDDLRDAVNDAESAAHRAAILTDQLQLFTGQRPLTRVPLDLAPVITDVLRLARPMLPTTITLVSGEMPSSERAIVLADELELERALLNLILNARDAMAGAGRLMLSLGISGKDVFVEVEDSGPGIPRSQQEQIFEPFFTTKASGLGTGLGLAMVQNVAAAHDGTVSLESSLGVGSTFRLTFPRLLGEQELVPRKIATPEKAIPDAKGNAVSILIVDDEGAVRRSLKRFLERRGMSIVTACDGQDALEILERLGSPPALVLTDIRMPRLDGWSLVDALELKYPQLMVAVMTGENVTRHPLPANVCFVALKPLAREQMDRLVALTRGDDATSPPI